MNHQVYVILLEVPHFLSTRTVSFFLLRKDDPFREYPLILTSQDSQELNNNGRVNRLSIVSVRKWVTEMTNKLRGRGTSLNSLPPSSTFVSAGFPLLRRRRVELFHFKNWNVVGKGGLGSCFIYFDY